MPSGRSYRSFEDFERDELHPYSRMDVPVDELLGDSFTQELDFGEEKSSSSSTSSGRGGRGRKKAAVVIDDDEE